MFSFHSRLSEREGEWLCRLVAPRPAAPVKLVFDASPFLFKKDEEDFNRIIKVHGADGACILAKLFPLKISYPHLVFDHFYTEEDHCQYFKNRFGIDPLAEDTGFDPEEERIPKGQTGAGRWTQGAEENLLEKTTPKASLSSESKTPSFRPSSNSTSNAALEEIKDPWTPKIEAHLGNSPSTTNHPLLKENGELIGKPGNHGDSEKIREIEGKNPAQTAKEKHEELRQHYLRQGYISQGVENKGKAEKSFPSEHFIKNGHKLTLNYRDDHASGEKTPKGQKTIDVHHDPEIQEKHGIDILKIKVKPTETPVPEPEALPKAPLEEAPLIPETAGRGFLPEGEILEFPELFIP